MGGGCRWRGVGEIVSGMWPLRMGILQKGEKRVWTSAELALCKGRVINLFSAM
jgi:hypothetical protein